MTDTMRLTLSKDRKVTNAVMPSGKTARIANAFGLPSGTEWSCPGATSICEKVCYAGKLETIYSGVRNVLLRNWNILNIADAMGGIGAMVSVLAEMVGEFVAECDKWNAEKVFRIHWDGDFFSEDYATAWAHVIHFFPNVQFWVYTRSFTPSLNVVPILADLPNLALYLSVDSANVRYATKVKAAHPGVNYAWLAQDFATGRRDIPSGDKVYNCPENGKRIPLISEKGSACVRCNVCVTGKGAVVFSVTKK